MDLKNQRVLVTGADGFIGSHLVSELLPQTSSVRALAFYNSFNSWGWLEDLDPQEQNQIEVITGDIRDPHAMIELTKDIDIIFHLAALIAIPFSYTSPAAYIETNILGTLNLLQGARKNGCSRFLTTSTSEVYGTALEVPITEKHPLQGQSPYSASKIGADKISESFHRSFDLPVITVRPFNTYGPRQSARAVIPTIIGQLLAGQTDIRLGALEPTRDLVFVKDTVAGFCKLATCDEAIGHEINISTGNEISIGNLAQNIIEIINPSARIVCENNRKRPKSSEVERLLGSCQKLKSFTGWKPGTTLNEGLAKTVPWFRNNLHRYKTGIYNI